MRLGVQNDSVGIRRAADRYIGRAARFGNRHTGARSRIIAVDDTQSLGADWAERCIDRIRKTYFQCLCNSRRAGIVQRNGIVVEMFPAGMVTEFPVKEKLAPVAVPPTCE